MQRLGRAAAAVLLYHRSLSADVLQGATCSRATTVAQQSQAAACIAGSSCLLQVQVQAPHVQWQAACLPAACGSSSSSSSSGVLGQRSPWRQLQQQPYTTAAGAAISPLSTAGHAMPALAPEQQRVQRHQELPPPPPAAAAADKPIEGVCHRRNVKCGWKKIDFVLRMVRRGTVDDAMAQLSANPKRAALFVKHAVANARGNAIFAGADPARLVVAEAFVTKGQYKKRLAIMGRGYSSIKLTRYSHLNVRVVQADEAQLAALALRRPRRTVAPIMVRMQGRRTARRAGGSTGGGWGGGNSGGGERRQAA